MLRRLHCWKLSNSCGIVTVLSAWLMGGCSIGPLPQDVTALDTKLIVKKIKCEAQDALKYQVEKLIIHDRAAPAALKKKWADLVYADIKQFPKFQYEKQFEGRTLTLIDKYSKYLLYLDFTFTIYDENNTAAEVNLLSTLAVGSNGLNLKAINNRKRQTLRNFRIRNTFQEVIAVSGCENFSTLPDPIYPITGEIGLFEVIDTFLELNENDSLSTDLTKDKVQLFASTLSFTTVNSGNAGPKIVLSPVGKPLSLADAGIVAVATRSDQHEVVIGMALPSDDPKSPAYIASRAIVPGISPELSEQSVRADTLDAFIDQQINRNLITNLGAQRAAAINLF